MIVFLWVLLIIASLVLQTTLLNPTRLYGVRLDLVLLLTIFAGLYRGEIKGGVTGFLGGILEDSLSGSLLGMGAISKTVAGFFSGFVGAKLYQKSFLFQLVVAFLTILIHELVYLCLIFVYGIPSPIFPVIVKAIAFTIILNTLLAPPFFWTLGRVFKMSQGHLSRNLWHGASPRLRRKRRRASQKFRS